MKFIVETKDGAVVGVDIAMKAMGDAELECSTKPDEQIGSDGMENDLKEIRRALIFKDS
jgi:hypothetical protein